MIIKKCGKKMPANCILNNRKEFDIKMSGENKQLTFKDGFYIFGWVYIKDSFADDEQKKYLFHCQTKNNSTLEVFFQKNINTIYLTYNSTDENCVHEISNSFQKELQNEWIVFTFQVECLQSVNKLIFNAFNLSHFEKPSLFDISLKLKKFKHQPISKLSFYKNLDCAFTSIVIGKKININKIFQKSKNKLLCYGLYNQKTCNIFLDSFTEKSEIIQMVYLPFKTTFNTETKKIEFQDIDGMLVSCLSEIKQDKINDMEFQDCFIHSFSDTSKRIQLIGGINALLPLFEILFTQNDLFEATIDLFEKLFSMTAQLLTKSKHNFTNAILTNFFQGLSLFLENIPKKFYTPIIYKCLVDIKDFYLNHLNYFDNFFNSKNKIYNVYLEHIFFNERIILRFPNDIIIKFWEQILIIVKDVCHFYQLHLNQENTNDPQKATSLKQENLKLKNLQYEHLNYLLNYKKFISILLYYESKINNKICCESHVSQYSIDELDNNDINPNAKEKFPQLNLSSNLELLEYILHNMINLNLFFKDSSLLEIFTLIPLNISLCIKNSLLGVLSKINCHRFSGETNDFLSKFKQINLVSSLIAYLGNSIFTEKQYILSLIVSFDKEFNQQLLLSKDEIQLLINVLIPNGIIKKDTESKSTFDSLNDTFNKNSPLFTSFEEYRKFKVLYSYNFSQWIRENYPNFKTHSEDEFCQHANDIYMILFYWLIFWIDQISSKKIPDKITEKIIAIFELMNYFVIRINKIDLIKLHLKLIESLFVQKRSQGKSESIYELIYSKVFWLYLFENCYLCYRINKDNKQNTLRGQFNLFKNETSTEEIKKILEEINSKCMNIIKEMAICLLYKDTEKTILYYLLTWGTYQKILNKSIEESEKHNKMLNDFIQILLNIYWNLIKGCEYQKIKSKKNYQEFTGIFMNVIYDFVMLFLENSRILMDIDGILEIQLSSIFYPPAFLMSQTQRITEYSSYLHEITLFILSFFDVQLLCGDKSEPKLKNCKFEEKQTILDDLTERYIFNKNFSANFQEQLQFLISPKPQKHSISQYITMIYLSEPLVKIILHFLCCLSVATVPSELPYYLRSIEFFLINLIIMSTVYNIKSKKGTTSQPSELKEKINKLIEQVLVLGFIFLLDQTNIFDPIKSILYFVKKILTHKNSSAIIQSPVYNVFANILKESDKHSLLNILKQETHHFTLNEIGDKFFNSKQYSFKLIRKNNSVLECIQNYFGKEEIVKHFSRIHCEIKDVIPIYNHVNIHKIEANSDASLFNLETNVNIAFSNKPTSTLTNEKNEMIQKQLFNLEKTKRSIYLQGENIKNIYKNIKQLLFSWKGVWSDKNTFYQHPESLKLKFLYHLSKDFTTPLFTPILDIDLYLPTFKSFNKKTLFLTDYDKATFYGVPLNIEKVISSIKNKDKPELEKHIKNKHITIVMSRLNLPNSNQTTKIIQACMVKQTHHLSGKLRMLKTKLIFDYEYYEEGTGIENNHLLYDNDNKTCFGSFFKNYKKDQYKSSLKIPIKSITLMMKRNYYYCNNSIEIFTENNKSYFFHFANNNERNRIIEEIKHLQDFKILKSQTKKENDELYYITSKFQTDMDLTINHFSEYIKYWETGKISNFKFIMFCNLLAGRSLRDLTQYPVFPWTLINYDQNELLYHPSDFRNFSLPMGMLEIYQESKKRKEQFKKEFKIMESEQNQEKEMDDSNDEENNQPTPGTPLPENENDPLQELQNVPYYYGTHYSNPLYVSHYLSRIFPLSQVRIEFQGSDFDPTRLFLSVNKTFNSATTQKSDVRELIPEFFFLPEIFINVNQLNFNSEQKETFDVQLPDWSNNKPYLFVKEMRKSLEYQENNEENGLNKWLNLIVGINRDGYNAKSLGNIFMKHTYTSSISLNKYQTRDDIDSQTISALDYYFRISELGLCPNLLVNEGFPIREKYVKKSIGTTLDWNPTEFQIKRVNDFFNKYSFKQLSLIQNKVIYAITNDNQVFTVPIKIFNNFLNKKINKETFTLNINDKFENLKKESNINSLAPKYPLLITKNAIIQACNETLYIHNKSKAEPDKIIIEYDKSPITVIICDKNEEFGFCGTLKGSILIYTINKIQIQTEVKKDLMKFLMKKKETNYNVEWKFKTCLNNHSKAVYAITINNNLNILGSSAKDGYINLYTIPTFKLFRSVKLCSLPYSDHLFISHCPVPCFVVFNEGKFLSYTINGNKIEIDSSFPTGHEDKDNFLKERLISSSYIFTEKSKSIQYLVIGTNTGFIQIREFPEMKLIKYLKVFNNSPLDILIPLNDENSHFMLGTLSENVGSKIKEIQLNQNFFQNFNFMNSHIWYGIF